MAGWVPGTLVLCVQDVFGRAFRMRTCQVGRVKESRRRPAALGSPGVVRSLQSCPGLEGGAINKHGLPPGGDMTLDEVAVSWKGQSVIWKKDRGEGPS